MLRISYFRAHCIGNAFTHERFRLSSPTHGEVAEWSKAHDSKSCRPQKGLESSNLSLSAIRFAPGCARGLTHGPALRLGHSSLFYYESNDSEPFDLAQDELRHSEVELPCFFNLRITWYHYPIKRKRPPKTGERLGVPIGEPIGTDDHQLASAAIPTLFIPSAWALALIVIFPAGIPLDSRTFKVPT